MTLRIGFTRKYFTLWNVTEPYKKYVDKHNYYMHVDYQYLRNLSMDESKAIKKAKAAGCVDLVPDHELYGRSARSFSKRTSSLMNELEDWQFPNGFWNIGEDIRECDDVKKLFSLYLKKDVVFHKEMPGRPDWRRPIVYARRRLVELGAIIKYDGQWMTPEYVEKYKAKQERNAAKDGHFYENRKRMELDLKKVGEFNTDTRFGTMYLVTFVDMMGRKFIYRSGKPLDVPISTDFISLTATIKHNNYNGTPQTLIQRVKI